MKSYTFFFVKDVEHAPTFDFSLFPTDDDAVRKAPELARDRTGCTAVEIWQGERLVDRLSERRSWLSASN
jgi:hypothetical protein